MIGRLLLLSGSLSLVGCTDAGVPASAYRHRSDQLLVLTGLAWLFPPCTTRDARGYTFNGATECYRLSEPQQMQGLWIDEFEGSQFVEKAKSAVQGKNTGSTWLEFSHPLSEAQRNEVRSGSRHWHIKFVGRRSVYPGHYGHFGMFDNLVIVDRLLSLTAT